MPIIYIKENFELLRHVTGSGLNLNWISSVSFVT